MIHLSKIMGYIWKKYGIYWGKIITVDSPLTDSPSNDQSLYNILLAVTVSLAHDVNMF